MGLAKTLGIGAGVAFGGMMLVQTIGALAGEGSKNGPPAANVAVPPNAKSPDASASLGAGLNQEVPFDKDAPPPSAAPPASDEKTARVLAISIILNGYGCQKVTDWSGDGVGGKNIVTCVERKGRPKIVRYEVEPNARKVTML